MELFGKGINLVIAVYSHKSPPGFDVKPPDILVDNHHQGGPKIRKNDITYKFFFLRGSAFDLPTYRGKLPNIDVETAVSDDFFGWGPSRVLSECIP